MNAAVQISGTNPAGTAPSNGTQSPVIGVPASGGQFNILLEMLASLTASGSPISPSPAGNASTGTGTSSGQSQTGSGAQSSDAALLKLEQELSALVSGGSPKSQGTASGSTLQTTAYIPAGLPFMMQYQQTGSQSGGQSAASGTPAATSQVPAALLSQIESDLAALLGVSQAQLQQSGSAAASATTGAAQQSTASSTTTPGVSTQDIQATASPALQKDLMSLLASVSGNTPPPNAVKELSAVISNMQGGESVQETLQKLKAAGSAGTTVQTGQGAQSSNPAVAPAAPAVQQAQDLPQDLTVQAVKTSAQSGASATVNGQSVQSQVTGSSVAAPASGVSAAVQSGNTTGQAGTSSGQTSGSASGTASGQVVQVQGSLQNQSNQDSTSSDKGSSDLLNTNATQAYAAAAANSKGSVTFQQTLSAASQGAQTQPARPDVTQLAQSIVKQANIMSQQGKTVVNMKLQPDALGSVTLQVSSEGGKISAQFNVKTVDARAYLEASVPQIKQVLETNGITVSHLNVSLSGGELQSGNQSFGYQPRRQGGRYPRYYSGQAAGQLAVAAPEATRSFGYNTMEMQI